MVAQDPAAGRAAFKTGRTLDHNNVSRAKVIGGFTFPWWIKSVGRLAAAALPAAIVVFATFGRYVIADAVLAPGEN